MGGRHPPARRPSLQCLPSGMVWSKISADIRLQSVEKSFSTSPANSWQQRGAVGQRPRGAKAPPPAAGAVRCGAVSAGCGPPELRQRPYLNAGGRGADLQAQPPLVVGAQPSVGREVLRAALGLREDCAHQQLQRVRLGLQQLRGGQR